MISKAIIKNTIKELIRTRWAIPIGIITIGVEISLVCLMPMLSTMFFNILSLIIFLISMLLTVGIIDSDVADGKIQTILAKPISYAQFFLSKVLGVILFGSLIIVITILSALIIISLKTGIIVNIKMWFLLPIAGIIGHILWVLISSVFSTFIKGHSNITAIILIGIILSALLLIPNTTFHSTINFINNHILPDPEACLSLLTESKAFLSSNLFHSLFYIIFLSSIGILIFNRKELGKR